jgi:hypothetical protein
MSRDHRFAGLLLVFALLPAARGAAVTNQAAVRHFSDVAIRLDGQTFGDEQVVEDPLGGPVAAIGLGAVPSSVALGAYQVQAGGAQLVAFDATVELPGGLVAEPRDVVQTNFDGSAAYTLVFDGSANAVPRGARVDAVSLDAGDLLLSFDTTVVLGAVTADDEDVVRFDGVAFTIFFDGSAAGVPAALDLDGFTEAPYAGALFASFDDSGVVGGVSFGDEDILEYDGSTWELAYDGSAADSAWRAADLGGAHVLTDVDEDELADVFETDTGTYVSEYDTGTDPLLPDTDGDGFRDGREVAAGSDPLDPGSVPPQLPVGGAWLRALLVAACGLAGHLALRRRSRAS